MAGKSTYNAEDNTKLCGRCQTRKRLDEFALNRSKADGHTSTCKWCDADRMRSVRAKIRGQRKRSWSGRKPGVRSGNQRCYLCGIDKPLAEFHRDRNRKRGHSLYCKICANQKSKEWLAANPERAKEQKRLRNFGLQSGDYAAMLAAQNGLCACCGTASAGKLPLAVDHCHRTGRVRALLCGSCNLGLGCFKDDPERLRKAVAYLTGGEN